jgi:hypothetical protein
LTPSLARASAPERREVQRVRVRDVLSTRGAEAPRVEQDHARRAWYARVSVRCTVTSLTAPPPPTVPVYIFARCLTHLDESLVSSAMTYPHPLVRASAAMAMHELARADSQGCRTRPKALPDHAQLPHEQRVPIAPPPKRVRNEHAGLFDEMCTYNGSSSSCRLPFACSIAAGRAHACTCSMQHACSQARAGSTVANSAQARGKGSRFAHSQCGVPLNGRQSTFAMHRGALAGAVMDDAAHTTVFPGGWTRHGQQAACVLGGADAAGGSRAGVRRRRKHVRPHKSKPSAERAAHAAAPVLGPRIHR